MCFWRMVEISLEENDQCEISNFVPLGPLGSSVVTSVHVWLFVEGIFHALDCKPLLTFTLNFCESSGYFILLGSLQVLHNLATFSKLNYPL